MLAKRLVYLRSHNMLTQQQVADSLGISRATYAHYEIGRRAPDHEMLKKLADFFEVSIDYLLGREPIDLKTEIDPENIKAKSDVEKIAEELMQSLNQALEDGVITEEQAKQTLDIARQTMMIAIDSKKTQKS